MKVILSPFSRLLTLLLLFSGCFGTAILTLKAGNDDVTRGFELRKKSLPANTKALSVFSQSSLSTEELLALKFLYTYMPLPDLVDYSGDFYRMNVDYALRARSEMPWGKSIPEREWLYFVLPVRVNNENLDESRRFFYEELKDRVRGLSLREAALEVNHWCHEKVTYRPSDARTSSPLASVRTAFGRCGEESTFTVAALRSVGIPARQVYTPRWAHTDDNHAWVEVWIDGSWHFMGACEPEAVLNLGWFNAPASRGMLMHTKVFGRYDGPEEVMSRTKCYTEINVTQNYAPVSKIVVEVMNADGLPLKNANVYFRLYNYAEFYAVAHKTTDDKGQAFLTAGRGDLLIWASDNGKCDFKKCTIGKDEKITLTLNKADGELPASLDLNVTPPSGYDNQPAVTAAQQKANKIRLTYEDSLRNAYVASFEPQKRVRELLNSTFSLQGTKYEENDLLKFFTASRGNYQTILKFLKKQPESSPTQALNLLSVLTEKDLRDVTPEVLDDNMKNTEIYNVADTVSLPYLLNPRIAYEQLTPYKTFFAQAFTPKERAAFQKAPELWAKWCRKHILIDNSWNPQSLYTSPEAVFKTGRTDTRSRNVFFVAGLRSFNVPARINSVTGNVEYFQPSGQWVKVTFETVKTKSAAAQEGFLKLTYSPIPHLQDPVYYTHFTLSKIVNGQPRLQEYAENATWSQLFKNGVNVEPGTYMLTTGTRMADGSVLSNLSFFNIGAKETKTQPLNMRNNTEGVKVIGNFNSENLYFDVTEGKEKSILSTTGRGYYIIGIIRSGHEPSDHALRDISIKQKELQACGRPILLLFESDEDRVRYEKSVLSKELSLPSTIHWGIDTNHAITKEIVTNMKLPQEDGRPIFLIADTFNRVVFEVQGYTIGLGEQLMKVINQLR